MKDIRNVIGIILAGGKGERLSPLTAHRAKPGVPFGGKYRIIDFVMNSFINSGIQNIKVLIQFKSQPLKQHIDRLYPSSPLYGHYIDTVSAQQKVGEEWYEGTADAVYQNLDILEAADFGAAAIFAGDHIFVMDVSQMYEFHCKKESEFTIAAIAVPVEQAAGQFGVIEVDRRNRVIGFEEKPEKPKEIPGRPGLCFASMGNYIADIPVLSGLLQEDAQNPDSKHDFGKNIIPMMLARSMPVYAYDFNSNLIEGQRRIYWRDVGTVRAYWEANMDLCRIEPEINLYNRTWPIRTFPDNAPPAKFIFHPDLDNHIISGGCIVSGARVHGSVLGQWVRVEQGANIVDSVIFPEVTVGAGVQLNTCIIDKKVNIPPGTRIGFSQADDEARGFSVVDGITVVPKGYQF